ncbi:hypothetical protein LGH70_03940 [Hymenobacter sp. BT635]|uniref:Carboxypeptidase regulatory-like domain-containing protein n=1 Tax=Hymenobacter nitidus TaxID=2880929 RepID=A0ABS8ABV5_9BACT|nr:hypothetical protein [Hymenobacter nitidus]MCB2376715.1 hypothetical protein [Hymenobacter nitidus]
MTRCSLLAIGLLGSLSQWLAVSRPAIRPAATVENYQVRVLQRKDPAAAPFVSGKIYGFDQARPLVGSFIKIDKRNIMADTSGSYHAQLVPGRSVFRAYQISYGHA